MGSRIKSFSIFDKYSENLKHVIELVGNDIGLKLDLTSPRYICPLCKYIFTRELVSVIDKNVKLTMEHVPPASLGGKPLILTCNKCNNKSGSQLESHLHKRIKNQSLGSSPGDTIYSRFVINEYINTGGRIVFDSKLSPNFVFVDKLTDPKFHEDLKKVVTGQSKMNTVSFSLPSNKENAEKEYLAILKSAYLLIFIRLGNIKLLCRNFDYVRELVMEERIITNEYKSIFVDPPDDMLGVHIIKEPKELVGYFVGISAKLNGLIKKFGVLIPGEGEKSKEFYVILDKLKNSSPTMNFIIDSIGNIDYLSKDNCLKGYRNWLKDNNNN